MNMQNDRPALTVSQLNEYVKALIDSDRVLSGVCLRAEISSVTFNSTGHLYMKLKDENSSIQAAMFRYNAQKLKFAPRAGMKVIALGRVSVYVPGGYYSFNIDSLIPDGAGELAARFEQLKEKLQKEGLFDRSHKKQIPAFPETIGVITSPTGAAIRDIINVCGRRYPLAKLLVFPVKVQGEGSAKSMIDALDFFSISGCADLLIIGRGGGSTEDLWEFNDEGLARAIYRCSIPVISAVGHEIDFTICDFVADLRAPTPSAAAELAVPDRAELTAKFEALKGRMDALLKSRYDGAKRRFDTLSGSYIFKEPQRMLESRYITLDNISGRLLSTLKLTFEKKRSQYTSLLSKLESLSPLAVLSRGYSALYSPDGRVITSVSQISKGDDIRLELTDGTVSAAVENVEKKTERKNKNGKQVKKAGI